MIHLARLPSQTVNNCRGIVNFLPGILTLPYILFGSQNYGGACFESPTNYNNLPVILLRMEDDNPKEIFWVLSVIGVVEKRRTRECTIYKHGPSRIYSNNIRITSYNNIIITPIIIPLTLIRICGVLHIYPLGNS